MTTPPPPTPSISSSPASSAPQARLAALQSHLSSMAAPRPPITCHVLDTTTGRPGASIPVRLSLVSSPPTTTATATAGAAAAPQPEWTSVTNSDGRVTAWTPTKSEQPLDTVFKGGEAETDADLVFSLRFESGTYFAAKGIKAFFPEVQVFFTVTAEARQKAEHFHVPLLLGPYTYTTYRGS